MSRPSSSLSALPASSRSSVSSHRDYTSRASSPPPPPLHRDRPTSTSTSTTSRHEGRRREDDVVPQQARHRHSVAGSTSRPSSSATSTATAAAARDAFDGPSPLSPLLYPPRIPEVLTEVVRIALYGMSTLLETRLDRQTLSLCVSMLEDGADPEALAVESSPSPSPSLRASLTPSLSPLPFPPLDSPPCLVPTRLDPLLHIRRLESRLTRRSDQAVVKMIRSSSTSTA